MELGTVTAAAEALHISQPAVSRTLQQAERRLGFPLFLRRKKRLLATPEAQSLFSETVRAFAAFDLVQKRAADLSAGRAGGLNIAAISAFANALLPKAVATFCKSRPDVVVTLQSMSALQVATHVANHQADLGFVIDSIATPGVSVSDLWATDFGCVMPRTHPLASKLHVVPADLEHERLICLGRQLPLGNPRGTRFCRCRRPVEDGNRGIAVHRRMRAGARRCRSGVIGRARNDGDAGSRSGDAAVPSLPQGNGQARPAAPPAAVPVDPRFYRHAERGHKNPG